MVQVRSRILQSLWLLAKHDIICMGYIYSAVVDNREAPSVTKSPSSRKVKINDKISLTCSATGNPTPIIRWYKDGKPIYGPQAIGDVFVIPEATPNERGFYYCEAFSSFGDPSKSEEALILIEG